MASSGNFIPVDYTPTALCGREQSLDEQVKMYVGYAMVSLQEKGEVKIRYDHFKNGKAVNIVRMMFHERGWSTWITYPGTQDPDQRTYVTISDKAAPCEPLKFSPEVLDMLQKIIDTK